MPPSPVVISLLEKKLNVPASPMAPQERPLWLDPAASAASSMTFRPCSLASAMIASMFAGWP